MHLDPDAIAWRARQEPDREAVFWNGTWFTYAELADRARRAADHLAALGLRPGDRVGVLAENHLGHLDLQLAAARTGVVVVPYNHRLTAGELAGLVAYTEPSVVFAGAGFARVVADAAPRVLDIEQTVEGVMAGKGSALAPARPDQHAMLLFTGGTTGLPKAACITHRQITVNAVSTILSWGLRPDDSYVCATPMFHAAVHALATPLLHVGGRVLIQERFDPVGYLDWVGRHRVSLLFLVPTMYQMLADQPGFADTDLSSVRWAISGGAPCPEPVRRAFQARDILFRQGYGLTECGVNCFSMTPAEALEHPDSVGRPILNLRARISDEDGGELGDEVVGELWLSGDVVMDGYFRRDDATAEALVEREGRRWLRTGDLARRDAAGRYFIVGRRKEMFISGGENVYPVEIERTLYQHPDVAECVVVGVPSERWGEVGLAAVVPRAGSTPTTEGLRGFLAERLARYKIPKHWVLVESLPKSGPGKILRREVAERWAPPPETT